jgi:hypothetical protein
MAVMNRSAARQGQGMPEIGNVLVMPARTTRMLAYRTPPVIEMGHLTMSAQSDDREDSEDSILTLAPVPLATGTVHRDDSGALVQIARIEIVLTLASGAQHTIPLQAQHGAWWAPENPSGN